VTPSSLTATIDPVEARALAAPLYVDRALRTGEPLLAHADGMVEIVRGLRDDADLAAAGYLFAAHDVIRDADAWLAARCGESVARLVADLRQLTRVSERTRRPRESENQDHAEQSEALRRMLLEMANDLRVVLLRLASRLQTLRWFAASKRDDGAAIAQEAMSLYAPLCNRLGIWQLKWELEDLSFRLLDPENYKRVAQWLEGKRGAREEFIEQAIGTLQALLQRAGIAAQISGRPKHIYSIWTKMRAKQVDFSALFDVRAVRVIVADVAQCYQVLSLVHEHLQRVPAEFDDYIARPKANGYQSLHTVVLDSDGRPLEIQIRTQRMHEFAEVGMAAHWRYKEGGRRAGADDTERIAWLRQLLAWRDDVGPQVAVANDSVPVEERIYVLTPQGRVVELPAGATPIDFAYHVHTELGHRCRGARIDGAMVPLNTKLATGQTVEIVAAKSGGPSRDWLNPDLGFLAGARSRAKVRHWFNLLELEQTIVSGRAMIDRELARLGKTAVKLDDLARRLGFAPIDELCAAATKDEFSLRSIEQALAATPAVAVEAPPLLHRPSATAGGRGKVLVVGVDSLLTTLARCCRPVPPDEIVGFVTRGKGVSIHRAACVNARGLAQRQPERVIEVAWGGARDALYPVDVFVLAQDRQGLLRDISEVFAREKLNVIGVQTESARGEAQMRFTVEVSDKTVLRQALAQAAEIKGVIVARRA